MDESGDGFGAEREAERPAEIFRNTYNAEDASVDQDGQPIHPSPGWGEMRG